MTLIIVSILTAPDHRGVRVHQCGFARSARNAIASLGLGTRVRVGGLSCRPQLSLIDRKLCVLRLDNDLGGEDFEKIRPGMEVIP